MFEEVQNPAELFTKHLGCAAGARDVFEVLSSNTARCVGECRNSIVRSVSSQQDTLGRNGESTISWANAQGARQR